MLSPLEVYLELISQMLLRRQDGLPREHCARSQVQEVCGGWIILSGLLRSSSPSRQQREAENSKILGCL